MKKNSNLFLIIMITLFSCGEQEPKKPTITISNHQFDFSKKLSDYKKDYKAATTSARESKVEDLREGFIEPFMKSDLDNWYGKVIDATSSYVEVSCNGVKYTLKPIGGDLDFSVFDLGEDLLFSGILDDTYWGDRPTSSGFYIKTHSITNYEKTKTYFSGEKFIYLNSQNLSSYLVDAKGEWIQQPDWSIDYYYKLIFKADGTFKLLNSNNKKNWETTTFGSSNLDGTWKIVTFNLNTSWDEQRPIDFNGDKYIGVRTTPHSGMAEHLYRIGYKTEKGYVSNVNKGKRPNQLYGETRGSGTYKLK